MTAANFNTTVFTDASPKQAFDAINNVRGWWSEEIVGDTDRPDAEFDYHFQDVHRCKMKITEFVPEKKVVWQVLDNYFKFTEDKSEWIGNTIIFEISEENNKTKIHFTQLGLTPDYECYEICENAWTQYLQQSLSSLISTGKGQPNGKEKPMTADEERLGATSGEV